MNVEQHEKGTTEMIIEEAENLKGERMSTVQVRRGEMVVNLDMLAIAFVESVLEEAHELSMGWQLSPVWYREQFRKIKHLVVPR